MIDLKPSLFCDFDFQVKSYPWSVVELNKHLYWFDCAIIFLPQEGKATLLEQGAVPVAGTTVDISYFRPGLQALDLASGQAVITFGKFCDGFNTYYTLPSNFTILLSNDGSCIPVLFLWNCSR